jgi:hypothetical protein
LYGFGPFRHDQGKKVTRNFGRTVCLVAPIWFLANPVAALTVVAAPPVVVAAPSAVAESPSASIDDDDAIIVTGSRQRGKVLGDIAPEIELGPQDIRAIGAGSIAELLQELGPQTRSGRGRGGDAPVILINGQRVSGFAEISKIPPEALARVDILPEEVALKYGYRANQRVVNFVLRERFRAVTTSADLGGPSAGGRASAKGEANLLRIRNGTRLSLEAEYRYDGLLRESARDIISSPTARPFDLAGNITAPTFGAEVDPALSALAGRAVTTAGVPASANTAPPSLADFVTTADKPNTTNLARYRSLLPESRGLTLGGSYAGTILGDVAATLTGGFAKTEVSSRLGLPSASLEVPAGDVFSPFANTVLVNRYAPDALIGSGDNWSGRIGTALNGRAKTWGWSLTANYSHAENVTLTDRGLDLSAVQARLLARDPGLNPYGPEALVGPLLQDRATSNTDVADASFVTNGELLALPAGGLAVSFKAGLQAEGLASESRRLGIVQRADLARTQAGLQGSFDLPITSVRNDFLGAIGNLSANLNLAVDKLSDFGTLTTLGYGLTWKPIEAIAIIASATDENGAPTIQQLGNPQVVTPNVRVFDFLTGNTVDVSRIDGGNRALLADHRRVFKLGLTLKPIGTADLTLTANFISSRIENPIAGFPTATLEIEAAFPERFRRDSDGQLLQINNRPVNFARSNRQELRWGISFSQPLKPSAAEREAAAARRATYEAQRAAAGGGVAAGDRDGSRQGGTGSGGGSSGGAGGGPGRRSGFGSGRSAEGRFQLSLFHTWHLQEQVLIRDGIPVLDLLNGSAIGSRGGQPRHEIEARAGIGKSGLGGRLSLNWQSGTNVRSDPSGATTSPADLSFSGLATINLRLFADLGQRPDLVQRAGWLRGTRISLAINNLANTRIDVRDSSGAVPIGYQRDLLDPLGRTLTLSFRKVFF